MTLGPSLPDDMQVVAIDTPGDPEVLQSSRRPVPRPQRGELLIRVAAAGVNRPDIMQRRGRYPPPAGASDLLGLEVAGEVVAAGSPDLTAYLGQRVCALVAGGGYAQFCLAPAVQCLPVPAGLSMVEAAALPETFFTVWTNVFERGRLVRGEVLLVHGGSSGIGTTAIQLGRAFGARVLATAGSQAKCDACVRLGAERAVNYREEDFVAAVREATEDLGADVILDMVGGEYTARNLDTLAIEGRLVQIAFLEGSRVHLDLGVLMRRRLTLTGSTLRPRTIAEKGRIARSVRQHVWPLLAEGTIRPVIHATFPLADAAAAHRLMEGGTHIGKIVLLAQ